MYIERPNEQEKKREEKMKNICEEKEDEVKESKISIYAKSRECMSAYKSRSHLVVLLYKGSYLSANELTIPLPSVAFSLL